MRKKRRKCLERSPEQALPGMFVPSQLRCPALLLSEVTTFILQPIAKLFLAFKENLSILFLKLFNTPVSTPGSNTTAWRECVGTGWGLPENVTFPARTSAHFCLALCFGLWVHCWDCAVSLRVLAEERGHQIRWWKLNTSSRKPLRPDAYAMQRVLSPEITGRFP